MFLLVGGSFISNDHLNQNVSKNISLIKTYSTMWDEDSKSLIPTIINRMYSFWVVSLPRFKIEQKIANIMLLPPLYVFSLISLWITRKKDYYPIILMISGCIFLTSLLHSLTFIDYSYRYRLPIIPLLIILSSISFNYFTEKIINYLN